MAAHAAHCHQLMGELGITRAHIVGRSSSVPVALQLALDAPEAVHTLTLMEAARAAPPTDTQQRFGKDVAQAAVPRSTAGCPEPSSRRSSTPTPSSLKRCPPSSNGYSPNTTLAASTSRRSPSWEQPAHRCSRNGKGCCCSGCPRLSHSSCRTSLTCCMGRTPPSSPKDSRTSSPAARFRSHSDSSPGRNRQSELLCAAPAVMGQKSRSKQIGDVAQEFLAAFTGIGVLCIGRPRESSLPSRWPDQPSCIDRSRVYWLSGRPRAISYRAALRGYQGSAHTAACGR